MPVAKPEYTDPIWLHVPPSSLAMTSALSSIVYAIELLELPKVMPMATRSLGPAVDAAASFSLISTVVKESTSGYEKKGGGKPTGEVYTLVQEAGWRG